MFTPGQPDTPVASNTANANPSPPAESHSTNSPVERKSSHTGANGLNARSCVTCRRRKVKCDKQVPCSNCVKAQTQCIFPAPGRAPRRPRQGSGKVVSEREAELLKRLRRLEGVVQELSGQVEVETSKHSPGSDNSSQPKDSDSLAGDPITSTGSSTTTTTTTSKTNNVRVIGMDEGSGTKQAWLKRGFALGMGPPKQELNLSSKDIEGRMGKLVLNEGKSEYVSNPYWASISEVCTLEDPATQKILSRFYRKLTRFEI
jgi:hypothetical protein